MAHAMFGTELQQIQNEVVSLDKGSLSLFLSFTDGIEDAFLGILFLGEPSLQWC